MPSITKIRVHLNHHELKDKNYRNRFLICEFSMLIPFAAVAASPFHHSQPIFLPIYCVRRFMEISKRMHWGIVCPRVLKKTMQNHWLIRQKKRLH